MSHTPGPWAIQRNQYVIESAPWSDSLGIGTDDEIVAWTTRPLNETNAALIAAAPELLQACKDALASGRCEWMRPIIAKAEGK